MAKPNQGKIHMHTHTHIIIAPHLSSFSVEARKGRGKNVLNHCLMFNVLYSHTQQCIWKTIRNGISRKTKQTEWRNEMKTFTNSIHSIGNISNNPDNKFNVYICIHAHTINDKSSKQWIRGWGIIPKRNQMCK